MKYGILVKYQTGCSFSSEDREEEIGFVWNSEELVDKALHDLMEHYRLCMAFSGESYQERQKLFNSYKNKDWVNKDLENINEVEYLGCMLLMDDGTRRIAPTSMYLGYFETLYSFEIIVVDGRKSRSDILYEDA